MTWLQSSGCTSTFYAGEAALPLCSYKSRTFGPRPRELVEREKSVELVASVEDSSHTVSTLKFIINKLSPKIRDYIN